MIHSSKKLRAPDGLTGAARGWVVTEQGPVSAGPRQIRLLHLAAQVEAVCNAMAVNENQGWPIISLRLAVGRQHLLLIGSDRDRRKVEVAERDRL